MARLWTSGFESQHWASEGLAVEYPTTGAATVTYDTTNKRIAATRAAISFNSSSTPGSAYGRVDMTTTNGRYYYFRGFIRLSSAVGQNNIPIFSYRLAGAPGTSQLEVRLLSTNKLQLYNVNLGMYLGNESTLTLLANTWYQMEVGIMVAGAGSNNCFAELRIDGVPVSTTTSTTFSTTALGQVTFGWLSAPTATQSVLYDDCALNDDQGTAQNSWCGEGKVWLLLPTADSARGSNWYVGAAATTNLYAALDNTPPTGFATANKTATSQIYNATNSTTDPASKYDATMQTYTAAGIPATDTIDLVQLGVVMGNGTAATARAMNAYIVSNPAETAPATFTGLAAISGIFPSNWLYAKRTLLYNPTVTRGTAPVVTLHKEAGTTNSLEFCFAGITVESSNPITRKNATGRTYIASQALTLYGSSVADSTITTASILSTHVGGGEVASLTQYIGSGALTDAEVWSQGGDASATRGTSIPTAPGIHGWIYTPGAGSFANDTWSGAFTMALAVNGATGATTVRFFKLTDGLLTNYSLIGSLVTPTATLAKTTYVWSGAVMPATTFTENDALYLDMWYHDASTAVNGDNPTLYLSNSSSVGVANDLQITTSDFTPASTSTRTRTKNAQGRTNVRGVMWYVSGGVSSSGDGTSWATAWKTFANITWASVNPGDTIEIDGGVSGITYPEVLNIGKSGTAGNPITLRASTQAGHDGTVTQWGGRTTPLPYSGQAAAAWTETAVRSQMLRFGANSYVIVDGSRWHGWYIYGSKYDAIDMNDGVSHNTMRYLEINDTGSASIDGATNTWATDRPAIRLAGDYHTVEYCDLHDCGQDNFQTGSSTNHLMVRKTWMHFTREHPTYPGNAFNFQRPDTGVGQHQDGYQIYGATPITDLTFEDCLFGPGLMQGTILQATTSAVTIRQCLFLPTSIGTAIMGYPGIAATNWLLHHITVFSVRALSQGALWLEGTGHTVTESIIDGGRIELNNALSSNSGNVQYNCYTSSFANSLTYLGGTIADPDFVTNVTTFSNPPTFPQLLVADFTPQAVAAIGKGCTDFTSVSTFLAYVGASAPETKRAVGRTRLKGAHLTQGIARVRVVIQGLRNASARTRLKGAHLTQGMARVRFFPQVTRRSVGRARLGVRHLTQGMARTRFTSLHLTQGMGRARLGVLHLTQGMAHTRFFPQVTRRSVGRVRFFPQVSKRSAGRVRFFPRTVRQATGRARLGVRHLTQGMARTRFTSLHLTQGMGRARLSIHTLTQGTGRTRVSILHLTQGIGRTRLIGLHLTQGIGRVKLSIGLSSTRNARAHARLVSLLTRNARARVVLSLLVVKRSAGRVRFKGLHLTQATGRARLGVLHLTQGMARVRFKGLHLTQGIGRARLGVRHLTQGMGRARVSILHTVQGTGRTRIGIRTSERSAGRVRFKGLHLTQATGRVRVLTSTFTLRRSVGRARLGVLHLTQATGRVRFFPQVSKRSAGRVRFTSLAMRRAAARLFLSGALIRNARGRVLVVLTTLRQGRARAIFSSQQKKRSAGRVRFLVGSTRRSVGRVSTRGLSHRYGLARMRVWVLGMVYLRAVGRAWVIGQSYKRAIGRLTITMPEMVYIVVEGAGGEIVTYGTASTIIEEGRPVR